MTQYYVTEVSTPQSIMDEDNVDVFAVALSDYAERPYYDNLHTAFWYTYRHRMIGTSCNDELWEVQLYDRVKMTMLEFDPYLTALFDENMDVTDLISDDTHTHEVLSDDETVYTPGVVNTHRYEDEDMPQTAAVSTTKYLSNRGESTDTPTGHDTTTHGYDRQVDVTGARTNAASLNAAIDARITRLYDEIVHRVSDLFLNRWF